MFEMSSAQQVLPSSHCGGAAHVQKSRPVPGLKRTSSVPFGTVVLIAGSAAAGTPAAFTNSAPANSAQRTTLTARRGDLDDGSPIICILRTGKGTGAQC
jgi:hypothetical protein